MIADGKPVPAFAAVKLISGLSGSAIRPVASSDPARVLGLAGGDRLLMANLTPEPQTVRAEGRQIELTAYGIASMTMGLS